MKSFVLMKKACYVLSTERLYLFILRPSAASYVLDYLIANREAHVPYNQLFSEDYFTVKTQKAYLKYNLARYQSADQFGFWFALKTDPDKIIGRLAFAAIVRGALQSCLVGYHLHHEFYGKGLMREALSEGCHYMFQCQKLHRIQADIMPRNTRSIKTAERCGFKREGMSRKYMAINGKWEDHYNFALINENYSNSNILR